MLWCTIMDISSLKLYDVHFQRAKKRQITLSLIRRFRSLFSFVSQNQPMQLSQKLRTLLFSQNIEDRTQGLMLVKSFLFSDISLLVGLLGHHTGLYQTFGRFEESAQALVYALGAILEENDPAMDALFLGLDKIKIPNIHPKDVPTSLARLKDTEFHFGKKNSGIQYELKDILNYFPHIRVLHVDFWCYSVLQQRLVWSQTVPVLEKLVSPAYTILLGKRSGTLYDRIKSICVGISYISLSLAQVLHLCPNIEVLGCKNIDVPPLRDPFWQRKSALQSFQSSNVSCTFGERAGTLAERLLHYTNKSQRDELHIILKHCPNLQSLSICILHIPNLDSPFWSTKHPNIQKIHSVSGDRLFL